MEQLFKMVLILSGFGLCLTALILALKPITSKKFPARWQYIVWILVMISMLVPAYKFIPKQQAQKLVSVPNADIILPQATDDKIYVTIPEDKQPTDAKNIPTSLSPQQKIRLWSLAAYIWLFGACIYMLAVLGSYAAYLAKKRKTSVEISDSELLSAAMRELNIKRKIRLKMSEEIISPMLAGVIYPTIYIPQRAFEDENMRMVFLHELTHYKRGDLIVKWLAVFVNAVHWFNPFAYILCRNVGEACEISCDMAVTKNMTADEQKIYMKTILDLVN